MLMMYSYWNPQHTYFNIEQAIIQNDHYLGKAVPYAFDLLMFAHILAFFLHVIMARLSLSENLVQNKEANLASGFHRYVFLTKYLMLAKVLLIFFSVTYA